MVHAWPILAEAVRWLAAGLLVAGLLRIARVDLRRCLIDDGDILALALLGLGVDALVPRPALSVAASVIGAVAFFATMFLWRRGAAVMSGHRDALGMGDVMLSGIAGLWTGWRLIPFVLVLATLFTLLIYAAVWIGRLRRGRVRARPRFVPMGPGLCLATVALALPLLFGLDPIALMFGRLS